MPRVLIADDNQQNAELLEAHLDGTGWETQIAANGEEALRLAREWSPDLILLDVMMPKLSGFEVCKRLRGDAATQHIGVLMVTALDQSTDIERALDAGTDDFLTKPIPKSELLLRARAMIESQKQTEAVPRGLEYFRRVLQGNAVSV